MLSGSHTSFSREVRPAFLAGFRNLPRWLVAAASIWILSTSQAQWSTVQVEDEGFFLRGNERTLADIEKIYADIPPVTYTPPPGRWQRLLHTAKCLQDGPVLKVVMLGDSIIVDTSRSGWDLLTARRYPHCRIEKVTSVRGSTGCWWYKENNRVKPFVLDHHPDLLMIGGISQREDIVSIREVIRQVRAGGCTADILLMTGAFGEVDPRVDSQWRPEIDPAGKDYRAQLRKLAEETDSAFLDMSAAWGRYIRDSGKDLSWFKRDVVHANQRGEQILGRVLDRYLAPESRAASRTLPSLLIGYTKCQTKLRRNQCPDRNWIAPGQLPAPAPRQPQQRISA
jgi:hypothetical protein